MNNSNINSDWKLINSSGESQFLVQFPILSKPKLLNMKGECISRIYSDELNSLLRYIGFYEFNQIFSLKYSIEFNEFLFFTLKCNSKQGIINLAWQICKQSECIKLIDKETKELIVKVEKLGQLGDQLAQVNIYKNLNNQLIIAILFAACVLLNQSKLFNQSVDSKSDKIFKEYYHLKR